MSQPLPLDEAVRALKLDPTRAVVARVDDLTVEMRVARPADEAQVPSPEVSAADLLRDLGPWEGESDAEFDDLFRNVRQKTNRVVPNLDR